MALAQFEGTLILVSHDRHLLRATTDNFMLVAKHRLQPFDGDLDDYRDWLLQHAAEQRAAAKEMASSSSSDDSLESGQNRKGAASPGGARAAETLAFEKAAAIADFEDREGDGQAECRESAA